MVEFYLIKDIFTRKQRREIIKKVQPFLIDGAKYAEIIRKTEPNYGSGYSEGFIWNKKTHTTLLYNPKFHEEHLIFRKRINENAKLNLELTRSWINLTTGRKKRLVWHNHIPSHYSGVYYLKSLPIRDGTLFKDHGFIKSPENSLLLFPSYLMHCTPASRLRLPRYSWAMDFVSSISESIVTYIPSLDSNKYL